MSKEVKKDKLKGARSIFLSGNVQKMRDLETASPTLIAKALGMNHSRYIHRLYHPDEFTIKHIINLANTLDLPPQTILDVILKQLTTGVKSNRKKIL